MICFGLLQPHGWADSAESEVAILILESTWLIADNVSAHAWMDNAEFINSRRHSKFEMSPRQFLIHWGGGDFPSPGWLGTPSQPTPYAGSNYSICNLYLLSTENQNLSDLLFLLLLWGLSTDAAAVLSTRKKIDVLDSHMSYLDTGNVADSDNTGEKWLIHGFAHLMKNEIANTQTNIR